MQETTCCLEAKFQVHLRKLQRSYQGNWNFGQVSSSCPGVSSVRMPDCNLMGGTWVCRTVGGQFFPPLLFSLSSRWRPGTVLDSSALPTSADNNHPANISAFLGGAFLGGRWWTSAVHTDLKSTVQPDGWSRCTCWYFINWEFDKHPTMLNHLGSDSVPCSFQGANSIPHGDQVFKFVDQRGTFFIQTITIAKAT